MDKAWLPAVVGILMLVIPSVSSKSAHSFLHLSQEREWRAHQNPGIPGLPWGTIPFGVQGPFEKPEIACQSCAYWLSYAAAIPAAGPTVPFIGSCFSGPCRDGNFGKYCWAFNTDVTLVRDYAKCPQPAALIGLHKRLFRT